MRRVATSRMVWRAAVGLAVWVTAASAIPGVGKAQEATQAAGPRTGGIQIGGRVIDGPPPPVAPETITRDASGLLLDVFRMIPAAPEYVGASSTE